MTDLSNQVQRRPSSKAHRRFALLLLCTAPFWLTACAQPQKGPFARLTEPFRAGTRSPVLIERIHVESPSDDGAIIIEKDGTVFDLDGAELDGGDHGQPPESLVGRGIVVRGAKNVTIRNGRIRGFKVGIYAEDAPGLVIENCDVSGNFRQKLHSTPFQENVADWLWPHNNDENEWLKYGSGIYLLRCEGAKLIRNRARRGQNGICLSRCNGVSVELNDMSYLSGWGLAMWRSSKCRVLGNQFDFCVRGFSAGRYARGQDSAGILMFEQCSENIIAFNSATHGGDGLFIFGGNETLKETGEGGCNRNLVYSNDFSHAVMNGIESTFSDDNVFVANALYDCYHGFWGGYCEDVQIVMNEFAGCVTGAAIEHARHVTIEENDFDACRRGLHLWWDVDANLADYLYAKKRNTESREIRLLRNRFDSCDTGMLLDSVTDVALDWVHLHHCDLPLHAKGTSSFSKVESLVADHGELRNETTTPISGNELHKGPKVQVRGKFRFDQENTIHDTCRPVPRNDRGVYSSAVESRAARTVVSAEDWGALELWRSRQRGFGAHPMLRPKRDALARDEIFVGRYGPQDPYHLLHEEYVSGDYEPVAFKNGSTTIVRWSPYGWTFRAKVIEGNVIVSPTGGVSPAHIEIKPGKSFEGVMPYCVRLIALPYRMNIEGIFIASTWNVAFHAWTPDIDPRNSDENWNTILASEPIHREKTNQLNRPWGGGAAFPGGPRDHFAVVATTQITLPAGTWRVRVISDDGIRVYRNGRRIIDDWTWHAPKEDVADFTTAAEDVHDFKVEYFEINGHAQLQFFLEQVEEFPAASMPSN